MAKAEANKAGLVDLLYQSLETEQGGIQVYQTAITCAVNDDLRKEWKEYLEQTKTHEQVMRNVLKEFGLDPDRIVCGAGTTL